MSFETRAYTVDRWQLSGMLFDSLAVADDEDFAWFGFTTVDSSEGARTASLIKGGTYRGISLKVTTNTTAAAEINTWTLFHEAAATALVLTIPVAVTGEFSTEGSITFVDNDTFSHKWQTDSAAGACVVRGMSDWGEFQ